MDTTTDVINNLESFGSDLMAMLEQLDIPAEAKQVLVDMIPSLYPEQLDNLYATLRERCIEQKTKETILADDEAYQQASQEIDQDTVSQLTDILDSLEKK